MVATARAWPGTRLHYLDLSAEMLQTAGSPRQRLRRQMPAVSTVANATQAR